MLFSGILVVLTVHVYVAPHMVVVPAWLWMVALAAAGALVLEAASMLAAVLPAAASLSRMRRLLVNAAEGDLSGRIQVSRFDPMRALLGAANRALANIRQFVAEDRNRLARAAEAIDEVRIGGSPALVKPLNRALYELEQVTAAFHLTEGEEREPTGEWVRGAADRAQRGGQG